MPKSPNNNLNQMQDFADSFYHRPHDPTIEVPTGSAKPWPMKEDGTWDTSEEEPTATKPSLRRRRAVLTWSVIAFTIGSLMIVLSSPYSNEFLAPGPLHSSHAQLLAGQGDRCAACHTGASTSAFGWVAHAFSGASGEQTQSQLCLECHKTTINEAYALNPHNVAPAELAKKSPFQNASFVSNFKTPPVSGNNELACSVCHREHKGAQDLKAMTDSQCQTCHQSDYHSFESDHAEFTNWPEASRQNIAFDHSTHALKHFPGSKTEFNCNQCHIDDAWQNAKIQAPFEQACASCHEKKIVDSGMDGFALLSLPMLDMKAIERLRFNVGGWPLAATGDFDGPIPAAMRALLMADRDAGKILVSKPDSFEFADFDPGNADDVRDAVTIAWSIKRLFHELSRKGSSGIKRRLELVFGRVITSDEIDGILVGMDDRSFAAASRRWFPKLKRDIESKYGDVNDPGLVDMVAEPGWLWKIRSQDSLAKNPLANDVLLPAAEQPQSVKVQPADNTRAANPTPQPTPNVLILADENAKPRTGWIRDDRTLRIFYRPTGHHDAFLKNWIDTVLATENVESRTATSGLFHALTEVSSIGNCRYCHTLKRDADQSLVMNWKANRRDGSVGQFTSFSHRPHLVQPVLQDCSHCHKMDSSVSNKESFASVDRLDFRSNFHPIEKATCSTCHQKGLTENSCTTCHNYHVGGQSKVNLTED